MLAGKKVLAPPCRPTAAIEIIMPSPRHTSALLCVWLALAGRERLGAQGVTGAAVQGTVAGADSAPVPDATVLVTNVATGERWRTVTRGDGRFVLDHLSVGGPYSVDVRAIGFSPARRTDIFMTLGQRLTFDVALAPAAVQLPEVSVWGAPDPRINAGRTGPAQTISRSTIVGLPIAGRDFTNLALLSPQVSKSPNGLLSVAGLNDRLTSVQVDGTAGSSARNDVGTGVAGIPLAATDFGNFPLPVEAVAALQVSVAPFDVREGGFAGGLIKAISQSGTNQWHGSLYSYFQNERLSGHNPDGSREDSVRPGGAWSGVGGSHHPRSARVLPQRGWPPQDFPQTVGSPSADTTAGKDSAGTGVRYSSLLRFQDILRRTYGVDPGSFTTESARAPLRTVFLKLSAQLGINNRLELSHDYAHVGNRVGGPHQAGLVGFNSNGAADPLDDHATRLNWTAAVGRWSNDLFLARTTHRHQCMANTPIPQVGVAVDAGVILAGSQFVCDGADNMETMWELTDNVGLVAGSHHLTFGMHGELIRVSDAGSLRHVPQPADWIFSSLDSLEQGLPDGYRRFVPGPLLPASGVVAFRGTQLGWYAQDQWAIGRRLTVTTGVRLDVAAASDGADAQPRAARCPRHQHRAHAERARLVESAARAQLRPFRPELHHSPRRDRPLHRPPGVPLASECVSREWHPVHLPAVLRPRGRPGIHPRSRGTARSMRQRRVRVAGDHGFRSGFPLPARLADRGRGGSAVALGRRGHGGSALCARRRPVRHPGCQPPAPGRRGLG